MENHSELGDEPVAVEARPPASERPVPTGPAPLAPYQGAPEYLAGLLHALTARIAVALDERWSIGLLNEVGPPMLDARPQIELMLARAEVVPGDVEARRVEVPRRAAVVEARLAASRARGIALPLADGLDAWQLTESDRVVLACLIAADVSPVIARLLAYLGGDAGGVTRRPTVETVAAVLGGADGGVLELTARLAADAPLRRLALVGLGGGAELPLLRRSLVVASRLVPLAAGTVGLDDDLRGDGLELQRERQSALAIRGADPTVYQRLRSAFARNAALPLTRVIARRGDGALAIVCDVALSLGRPALRVRAGAIRGEPAWLDALAREVALHRAAVVIDHDGRPVASLVHRLARFGVPLVIVCDAGAPPPALDGLPAIDVELPAPRGSERARLWSEAIEADERGADLDLAALATTARVGAAAIEHAAANARAVAAVHGRTRVTRAEVIDGLRSQLSGLARIARREPPARGWDALVLPGDILDQVFELVYEVRERRVFAETDAGRGAARGAAVALITGAPGTGKTMVASLLARDLGLDLVELDVPSLTPGDPAVERGLDAAFVAADAGLALLGFDRATHLHPSLLERLRRSFGVAVLMASDDDAIDLAARRVVANQVALPFPAQPDRERLWANAFPPEARHAEALPFEILSRELKLSGGQIRLIALRATALATAAGESVSLERVRALARRMLKGAPDGR